MYTELYKKMTEASVFKAPGEEDPRAVAKAKEWAEEKKLRNEWTVKRHGREVADLEDEINELGRDNARIDLEDLKKYGDTVSVSLGQPGNNFEEGQHVEIVEDLKRLGATKVEMSFIETDLYDDSHVVNIQGDTLWVTCRDPQAATKVKKYMNDEHQPDEIDKQGNVVEIWWD